MRLCGLKSKTEPREGKQKAPSSCQAAIRSSVVGGQTLWPPRLREPFWRKTGFCSRGREGEDCRPSCEAGGGRCGRDGGRPCVRVTRLHHRPSAADRPPSRHSCRRGDLLGCANNRSCSFPAGWPSRGACCSVRGLWIPILHRLLRTLSGVRIRSHPTRVVMRTLGTLYCDTPPPRSARRVHSTAVSGPLRMESNGRRIVR